jgi:methanogenic corrinoid protein MtbC1
MAARVLEADGWTVRYLGTHLPPASILHAVSTVNPDILAVSATMLHNLPGVRALIQAVHEQYGARRPRIAVCGAVVQQVPDIADVVGADRSVRGLQDALPVMRVLFAERQAPADGGV